MEVTTILKYDFKSFSETISQLYAAGWRVVGHSHAKGMSGVSYTAILERPKS